jgi:hypothetical protein
VDVDEARERDQLFHRKAVVLGVQGRLAQTGSVQLAKCLEIGEFGGKFMGIIWESQNIYIAKYLEKFKKPLEFYGKLVKYLEKNQIFYFQ